MSKVTSEPDYEAIRRADCAAVVPMPIVESHSAGRARLDGVLDRGGGKLLWLTGWEALDVMRHANEPGVRLLARRALSLADIDELVAAGALDAKAARRARRRVHYAAHQQRARSETASRQAQEG